MLGTYGPHTLSVVQNTQWTYLSYTHKSLAYSLIQTYTIQLNINNDTVTYQQCRHAGQWLRKTMQQTHTPYNNKLSDCLTLLLFLLSFQYATWTVPLSLRLCRETNAGKVKPFDWTLQHKFGVTFTIQSIIQWISYSAKNLRFYIATVKKLY